MVKLSQAVEASLNATEKDATLKDKPDIWGSCCGIFFFFLWTAELFWNADFGIKPRPAVNKMPRRMSAEGTDVMGAVL